MLKKISNWFGNFRVKIETESIEGNNIISKAIEQKEELFNLLAHYYEDKDLNKSLIQSLYEIAERDTQYSLADIDDITLIGLLQRHIVERDFQELTK